MCIRDSSDPNDVRWAVSGLDRCLHTGTVATVLHGTAMSLIRESGAGGPTERSALSSRNHGCRLGASRDSPQIHRTLPPRTRWLTRVSPGPVILSWGNALGARSGGWITLRRAPWVTRVDRGCGHDQGMNMTHQTSLRCTRRSCGCVARRHFRGLKFNRIGDLADVGEDES